MDRHLWMEVLNCQKAVYREEWLPRMLQYLDFPSQCRLRRCCTTWNQILRAPSMLKQILFPAWIIRSSIADDSKEITLLRAEFKRCEPHLRVILLHPWHNSADYASESERSVDLPYLVVRQDSCGLPVLVCVFPWEDRDFWENTSDQRRLIVHNFHGAQGLHFWPGGAPWVYHNPPFRSVEFRNISLSQEMMPSMLNWWEWRTDTDGRRESGRLRCLRKKFDQNCALPDGPDWSVSLPGPVVYVFDREASVFDNIHNIRFQSRTAVFKCLKPLDGDQMIVIQDLFRSVDPSRKKILRETIMDILAEYQPEMQLQAGQSLRSLDVSQFFPVVCRFLQLLCVSNAFDIYNRQRR